MSFGGASSGNIRYTITVDDAQAIQKLQGVAQQFQALGTTTQQTTQQMEQMPTVYDDIAASSDKVAQSQQTMTDGIKAQGDEVKKSTVAQQSWGSTLKNNIFAITSAVGGIISLVQQYTSLQRQQLVIQKMTNTEIGQRNKIAELTRKHAQAVREFGASSQEVLKIETDLDLLQKKHEVTVKTLEIRQEQLNLRMADFGLNILPNLMSAGGGIAQVIIGMKGLKTAQDAAGVASVGMGIKMKGALIGTGIGAILVAIGGFLVLFTRNLYGVQDAVFGLGQKIGAAVPQLQGFLNMLKDAGIWLIRILGGELPAGADKAAASIAGVTDETKEFAISGQDAAAAAEEMKKQTEAVKSSYASFMGVLKTGKDAWGETKKLLKEIGFGKGAIEKIHLGIEFEFEKPQEALKNLEIGLNAVREFHLSPSTQKEVAENFVEDMRKSIKKAGGDLDILKELVDIVKTHKKDPNLANLVAGWFAGLPQSVREELIRHGISPDEIITNMGFDPAKLKTEAQKSIDKAIGGVKLDFSKIGTPIDTWMKSQGVSSINEWAFGKKDEGATKVEGLLDKIKTAVTTFDWKGVADTMIKGIMPRDLWVGAGATIRGFLNEGLSQESVAGARLGVRNAIATSILDRNFWVQVGITTLGFVVEGIQKVEQIKMSMKGLMDFILDRETWVQVGITTLGFIAEGLMTIEKVAISLDNLVGAILDRELWVAAGTTILGFIAEGFNKVADIAKGLWQTGKDVAGQIWEGMKSFFSGQSLVDIIPKLETDPNKLDKWNPFTGKYDLQSGTSGFKMKPISLEAPVTVNTQVTSKYTTASGAGSRFGSSIPSSDNMSDFIRNMTVREKMEAIPISTDVNVGIQNVRFMVGNPATSSALGAAGGGIGEAITKWLKGQGIQFAVTGGPILQWPFGHKASTTQTTPQTTMGRVDLRSQQIAALGGGGKPGPAGPQEQQITRLQKALANLANQGANSMRILGKAAATNFNTVANYARGATPDVFKLQKALANLANQGSNSTRILGKAATTNFNTVANYASGAVPSLTKLQKALANLANQGSNSMRILAKAAKTNFNTVANYANGATTAVDNLQSAIDNLESKSVTLTVKRKLTGPTLGRVIAGGGSIDSFRRGGLISAAKGFITNGPELMLVGDNPGGNETIAVVPHDNPSDTMAMLEKRFGGGGGGAGFTGSIIINLTNVLADKEITRTFRRELGKELYRFGPT